MSLFRAHSAIHKRTATNRRSGLLLGVELSGAVTAGRDSGSSALDPDQPLHARRLRLLCTKQVLAQKSAHPGIEVLMEGCSVEAWSVKAESWRVSLHCFGARRQEREVDTIRDQMKLRQRWQTGPEAKSTTP